MVIYAIFIFLLNLLVVWWLLKNWTRLKSHVGKFAVAIVMFAGPIFIVFPVAEHDFTVMKSREFCMQCHVMHPYGDSLKVDDNEPLSAVHAQNNYVPQKTACYSCHTDYDIFGPFKAKFTGLRHLWVHMTNSAPKKLKLYHPYNTANCLYCHADSKKFLKNKKHNTENAPLEDLLAGRKTCLTSGCHDMGHLLKTDDE